MYQIKALTSDGRTATMARAATVEMAHRLLKDLRAWYGRNDAGRYLEWWIG